MKFFHNYTLIFFLLFVNNLFSQKIIIVDSISKKPIPSVLVFDLKNDIRKVSDKNGVINLKHFKNSRFLNFSHISYKKKRVSKDYLKKNGAIFLKSNSLDLDQIVLSVARSRQNVSALSKKVQIIENINKNLTIPKTTADMLRSSAGIHVQKSQGGGGSPVIRGFEANRVLLVIDGVRMNNAIYRSGHLQNSITVDPYSLERTEVIFGPSSVGYGSDALGGVIHFYTKKPRLNRQKVFNLSQSISYNLIDYSKANNFSFEISKKKWASYTNFTRSKFGDIVMGKNRTHNFSGWGLNNFYPDRRKLNTKIINEDPNIQKNTAYNQIDLLQKFNFKINEDVNFILNFQFSESSNVDRYDKLNELDNIGDLKYAEWYYGPQNRTFLSSKFIFRNKSLYDRLSLIFSFQKIKESRNNRKFNSENLNIQNENLDIFSINADFFKRLNNKNSIAYGFELNKNFLDSKGFITDIINAESNTISESISRYPNGGSTYESVAAYSELRKSMSKKLNLNMGLRYSLIKMNVDWEYDYFDENFNDNYDGIFFNQFNDFEMLNSSLTGSFGLAYRLNTKNKLSLNFSTGFRSPNIDDIGKIRVKANFLNVPNSQLKPEYANTFDLGWSKNYKNFKSNLNIYYTILNRTIGRNYFGGPENRILYDGEFLMTMANFNMGQSIIYGFNFDFKSMMLQNFILDGYLNYTYGKMLKDNMPMPSIPPLFGMIGLKLVKDKAQYKLAYSFSGSKSANLYSLGGEDGLVETPFVIAENGELEYLGMPEWGILQFYSQFKINSPKKKINIKLIIDNIFDIHYREFASGVSSPGRTIALAVSLF